MNRVYLPNQASTTVWLERKKVVWNLHMKNYHQELSLPLVIGQLRQEGRAEKPRCPFWEEMGSGDGNDVQEGLFLTAFLLFLAPLGLSSSPGLTGLAAWASQEAVPSLGLLSNSGRPGHKRGITQAPPFPKHALTFSGAWFSC